ncbi:MAG: hypothetical protein C5B43_03975 [Verrucomicrobia bacterium]|nr:MAG: hypothetical protein C5B43_03975 [Verrucomicrobiota bacterium]
MPQLSYNFLMNIGVAGELYDIGFNNVLSPVSAIEPAILPGQGLAKIIGQDMQVRLPHVDIAVVTASAPLSAGNSTVVTLNGIALSPVVYATSNAATLAAIAALIAAQDGIASAVSNGTDTITINATQGFAVSATFVTSGGSGVTWTTTYSNDNVFYGVAVFIQNKMNLYSPQGSVGPAPYIKGDAVPALTRGRIYVTVENNVTSDSPVYWRIAPTLANPLVGGFRSDSDGGTAILLSNNIVRWITSASTGNLAVLEINQP